MRNYIIILLYSIKTHDFHKTFKQIKKIFFTKTKQVSSKKLNVRETEKTSLKPFLILIEGPID